ncbi:MAG: 23S rRNA (pseudouridine(1915)-N(3))-methyltransferase RlmH [Candidatus Brocadiaceae bacterium]|nr:23S rRNA (pseudouridine(1915)-N(3))-methyltransferase RlmH [Candidatus Brocadiaceae bacterium]
MKIELIVIGKTEEAYLREGISVYAGRLQHYCSFSIVEVPSIKPSGIKSPEEVKIKEAAALEKVFTPAGFVVLMDEKGKEMSSVEFAGFLSQKNECRYPFH